jgi:hypothetical protein
MLLAAIAYAQEPDPAFSHVVAVPGVASEVRVFTGAPAGFDPKTASDEELLTYGFPRRPDPSDVKAYKRWSEIASFTREDVTVTLNPGKSHRPVPKSAKDAGKAGNVEFLNWSGYALIGGSPKFDEIVGVWVVANIGTQFEKFTGYSSTWVGIDGDCSCNDLIQDGTEQDWIGGSAHYYSWVEFIPLDEMRISLTVQPGDIMYASSAMVVKDGKTYGSYNMANYNTRKTASLTIAMPSGDKFSGASAEWIMERTEVDGSFENPLPYYAFDYMDNAWAYREGSNKEIDYLSEAGQHITMVTPGGKALSTAYEQDGISLWFEWLAYP